MDLAPGTPLDRYTVQHLLGRGGMAAVYLARHRTLGTLHAIKILHGQSAPVQQRLLQEGRVQGNLQHRNVVRVTDVVEIDGAPGLVMEYVAGPTLAQLLAGESLDLAAADALARDILDGVAAAHRAGLVHRDLKPGNVLLAVEDGRLAAKVTDFGLAKVLAAESGPDRHATRTGTAMGTPAYMAPEQIRDASRVDGRADVFALGCILYELVSGRCAFQGADSFEVQQAIVAGRVADVRTVVPSLPGRMAAAIQGALQVDPELRFGSVEALRDAWIDGEPAPSADWGGLVGRARAYVTPVTGGVSGVEAPGDATWTSSVAQVPPVRRRPPFARLAGVATLVALAGAAYLAWPRAGPPAHVLTTTTVPVVTDDPLAQQQFAEGWHAYLDADFRDAQRKLAITTATDPADPLPWALLAQAHFGTGNTGEAVQAAWTSHAKCRTFDSPLSVLLPFAARANMEKVWAGEVADAFHAHFRRYPDDYFVLLIALDGAEGTTAEEMAAIYERALAKDPEPAITYHLFALDRLRRGLWDEAEAAAARGLQGHPGSPALLARMGRAQLGRGAFAEARDTCRRASQADPGLLEARVDLALAARMVGDEVTLASLDAQLTDATAPIADRFVYAAAMSEALVGLGRVREADALLRRVGASAQAEGAWGAAMEVDQSLASLYLEVGRYEAVGPLLTEAYGIASAPELASELRHRWTHVLALLEGMRDAGTGDLEAARSQLARLRAIEGGNVRDLAMLEHEIALAAKDPAGLRLELYGTGCDAEVAAGRALLKAGDPTGRARLAGVLADTKGCRAWGLGRYGMAAAHVELAAAGEDPEGNLARWRTSMPAADGDLPIAVLAGGI